MILGGRDDLGLPIFFWTDKTKRSLVKVGEGHLLSVVDGGVTFNL